MFEKVKVNGKHTHPVFCFLKHAKPDILGNSIKWSVLFLGPKVACSNVAAGRFHMAGVADLLCWQELYEIFNRPVRRAGGAILAAYEPQGDLAGHLGVARTRCPLVGWRHSSGVWVVDLHGNRQQTTAVFAER